LKLKFNFSGRRQELAYSDDPVEAAARLEGALERIARHAARAARVRHADPGAPVSLNETLVAQRLDSLIARLRAVLELPRT
jgi:hypothetical protein